MRFENPQTEIDPEARTASAAAKVSAVRPVPMPTLPASPLEVPASTIASPDSSPAPTVELAECAIGSAVVGRYSIEKKLGQGGMGAVYLCRDRRLMDKLVVVKVLLGVGDEWGIRKFLQEIEALTRLKHPGIVGILDAGELLSGKPFLVMEYIDGVTLQDALAPGSMDLKRAGNLIGQIGSALAAAHNNGIYHRDLKPANIMLERLSGGEEKVRIIDFGIAKVHDSLVSDHTVAGRFGTPIYMSPEQFRVEEITAASDIYSMAAIAYEMVTGRVPFDPRAFPNLGDMYTAGLQTPPRELRRELPERAQKLILKALSLRSQDRFQNAVEFGNALAQSLFESRPVRVRPPSFKELAKRLPDRARFIRLAAPVFVVMLMALAVVVIASLIAPIFWGGYKKPETKPAFESRESALPSTAKAAPAPQISFTYWLTVDKARPGQGDKNPYESLGTETFESGDEFQFKVVTAKPGYLYVLNEATTDDGKLTLTLIYPRPSANGTPTIVEEAKLVETFPIGFEEKSGIEHFRIVWSTNPVSELEAARKLASEKNGRLPPDELLIESVRRFLSDHAGVTPQISMEGSYKTIVNGTTDPLVKALDLEHH